MSTLEESVKNASEEIKKVEKQTRESLNSLSERLTKAADQSHENQDNVLQLFQLSYWCGHFDVVVLVVIGHSCNV